MATLQDVAKRAGVSIATVSRFINGNYRISTQNHALVLKAMEELGYSPPKKTSTRKNVMIISNLGSSRFVTALENCADKYNCTTMYKYNNDSDIIPGQIPLIGEFDGIIINSALMGQEDFDHLRSICPVVMCNIIYSYPGSVSVTIDFEQAAYELTKRMLDRGLRQIMFIGDLYQSYQSDAVVEYELIDRRKRLNGYRRALSESGLEPDDEMILLISTNELANDKYYHETTEGRIVDIVARKNVEGIICTIPVAGKLSETLSRAGLRMGGDISFATFGSAPPDAAGYDYDYIHQPADAVADAAFMTLSSMMRGEYSCVERLSIFVGHVFYPANEPGKK